MLWWMICSIIKNLEKRQTKHGKVCVSMRTRKTNILRAQFFSWLDSEKQIKSNMLLRIAKEQCVKSVRIRSYSGPHFLTFGLNSGIQSECGKMRTRITPNTENFYAMERILMFEKYIRKNYLRLGSRPKVFYKKYFWIYSQ